MQNTFLSGRNYLMKISFVLGFMLIAFIGEAQDKFIGQSYGDINTEMVSLHNANTITGETNVAGQYQATYKVGEGFAYSFLFNKSDNTCTGVKEIMSRDAFVTATANLDKQYNKVDDNHWLSKDKMYRVILDVSGDNVVVTHVKNK